MSSEILQAMADRGLDLNTIAQVTGVPRVELRRILTTRSYAPDEDEILNASRALALKVINKAFIMLDTSMPEIQLQIMRSFLPVMARMIGRVQDETMEEYRLSLDNVWEELRRTP